MKVSSEASRESGEIGKSRASGITMAVWMLGEMPPRLAGCGPRST